MIVNALVSILIVFRIFQVYQQVKYTSDEQTLGTTGGRKLYSIMSIIIESGVVLFAIQLIRFVSWILIETLDPMSTLVAVGNYTFQIIGPIQAIFNVIIKLVMSTPYFY